ncbi:MAG: hypothetical protein ACREUU_02080 [Gammaproteobacteria bacterium]
MDEPCRLDETELASRAKGDGQKAALAALLRRETPKTLARIARRLRDETTMTLEWIAGRLNMGAAGYAAQCLRQTR